MEPIIQRPRLIHMILASGHREPRKFSNPLLFSTSVGTRNLTTLLASFSLSIAAEESNTFPVCTIFQGLLVYSYCFPEEHKNKKFYMRGGTTSLLPAKYKFKQIRPLAGSLGTVATSTPRKPENNDNFKEGGSVSNDKAEPIVTFGKPPPQPPILGPFVALSLLETWSRRDGDDN